MSPCRGIMIITVTPWFIMAGTLRNAPGDLKLWPRARELLVVDFY